MDSPANRKPIWSHLNTYTTDTKTIPRSLPIGVQIENYSDGLTELVLSLSIYRDGYQNFKGPVILAYTTEDRNKRLEQLSITELQRLVWQFAYSYTGDVILEITELPIYENGHKRTPVSTQRFSSVSDAFDEQQRQLKILLGDSDELPLHKGILDIEAFGRDKKEYSLSIEPINDQVEDLVVTMQIYDPLPNFNPIEVEYLAGQESLKAIVAQAKQNPN